MYGGSPKGLASRAGFEVEDVEKILDLITDNFPGLMYIIGHYQDIAIKTGITESPLGRIRSYKESLSLHKEHEVKREAFNTIIQSLASDLNLLIALRIFAHIKDYRLKSKI